MILQGQSGPAAAMPGQKQKFSMPTYAPNNQQYVGAGYNQAPSYANGQNLTNLGYQPRSNGVWDPAGTGQNPGGPASLMNGMNSGGSLFGSSSGSTGSNPNDPYSIQNLINMQVGQNNQTRQQNQNNWNSVRNNLQGIPGQYNNLASTQGAQSLTNQLSANPLSLSPTIVQQMKNEAGNQIAAQGDNQFQQVKRALSADGQTDASSQAAALEAQGRQNMGAQQTQNTAIDIAAAKQRPIDLANAAGVAQRQSGQDIGVPMQVGNSIMSNLPQVKPDDYTGLLALTNQMQNQQFQTQMLANQQGAPRTPTAYNPIGGSYSQNGGGGAGFSFQQPYSGGQQQDSGGYSGGYGGAPYTGSFQNASPWYPGGNGAALNSPVGGGGLMPFGDTSGGYKNVPGGGGYVGMDSTY